MVDNLNFSQGQTECSFDDRLHPELLHHLLWDGPEELPIDPNGRAQFATARASPTPLEPKSLDTANPFAPGFKGQRGGVGETGVGAAAAVSAPSAAYNPFAAPPPKTRDTASAPVAVNPFGPSPARSTKPKPLAASETKKTVAPRSALDGVGRSLLGSRKDVDGSGGDAQGGEGSSDRHPREVEGDNVTVGSGNTAVATVRSTSDNDQSVSVTATTSSYYPQAADSAAGTGIRSVGSCDAIGAGEGPQDATPMISVPPAFTFDDAIFRSAGRLFGPHLGGKSYVFGKQRAEVTLRAPGALRLGIWRPPVDEREEKEREKDKGKAATIALNRSPEG